MEGVPRKHLRRDLFTGVMGGVGGGVLGCSRAHKVDMAIYISLLPIGSILILGPC